MQNRQPSPSVPNAACAAIGVPDHRPPTGGPPGWQHGHVRADSGNDALRGCRVLVVDDDPALAEMLGIVLTANGLTPSFVADGDAALRAFHEFRPDLVLLDLMLPGTPGLEVCRAIRAQSGVPIVMLTARGDTFDVVTGLESGADDYVIKPFKPGELVARVRARLRRRDDIEEETTAAVSSTAPIECDTSTRRVLRDEGEPTPRPTAAEMMTVSPSIYRDAISLTPLEFDLLVALARRPRQVFTREQLLEQVWGYRHAADTRLVNVHVQRLRAKVERDPEHPQVVVTVRGVGYKAGPP